MVVMSWRVTAIVQTLALFNQEAHLVSFGIVMVPIVDIAVERTLFSFFKYFFFGESWDILDDCSDSDDCRSNFAKHFGKFSSKIAWTTFSGSKL